MASRGVVEFHCRMKLEKPLNKERPTSALISVNAVVDDAEEAQVVTNPNVKAWIAEGTSAVYDAEDHPDEITEAFESCWESENEITSTREPSVLDTTNAEGDHVSIDVARDAPLLARTALGQISSENVCEGHSSRRKINKARIFVMLNFLIELLSAIFDQLSLVHKPNYALIAMLMSFIASIICITELAFKAGERRVVWRWESMLPWLYYPSPMSKRFGSVPEIIGLICAILQSISSTLVYIFYMRHADYPIKISFWPIVFALCLLCSKFMPNSDQPPKKIRS